MAGSTSSSGIADAGGGDHRERPEGADDRGRRGVSRAAGASSEGEADRRPRPGSARRPPSQAGPGSASPTRTVIGTRGGERRRRCAASAAAAAEYGEVTHQLVASGRRPRRRRPRRRPRGASGATTRKSGQSRSCRRDRVGECGEERWRTNTPSSQAPRSAGTAASSRAVSLGDAAAGAAAARRRCGAGRSTALADRRVQASLEELRAGVSRADAARQSRAGHQVGLDGGARDGVDRCRRRRRPASTRRSARAGVRGRSCQLLRSRARAATSGS